MISLLLPTRKRPDFLARMVTSARRTAAHILDIICYIDEDDLDSIRTAIDFNLHRVIGPRITLSDTWNRCLYRARGDIIMMCADDMIFRTPGWDQMIKKEFASSPDKILMVHGDDWGYGRDHFGVFPTVHRYWIETLGYFMPPGFVGDFPDAWLNDVANALGRRRFLPYVTEHMHHLLGKASYDDTYRERKAKEESDPPQSLYDRRLPERLADIEKLRKVMNESR